MTRIFNRKSGYLYTILEKDIEAGLILTGSEAKTLRNGQADLSNAHIRILFDGVYLVNANIPINSKNGNPTRARKLLLNRNEIVSLSTKIKQQNLILVPLALYNKGPLFKLELALGKPKKKFEKREYLKKKDVTRELEEEFKDRFR